MARHILPKRKRNRRIRYLLHPRTSNCTHDSEFVDREVSRTLSASTLHDHVAVDMDWYDPWLSCQLETLPDSLRELRVGSNGSVTSNFVMETSTLIERFAQDNEGSSIDEIIEHLYDEGVFEKTDSRNDALHRLLVFAILGWRSMLYRPAFNVCSLDELAIHQDSDQQDSGLVFDSYKVSADLSDRPLHILLKGFGNLLPASPPPRAATEVARSATSWTALYPSEFNAHFLHVLLGVRFRWVDSLALHLDYDKSTRTLSLFAFPSHCIHMLQCHGAIFAFASTENGAVDPRADANDVRNFLREVLMSYRLLFGQSRKAQKVFRSISSGGELPFPQPDTLLSLLCASEKHTLPGDYLPADRTVYFAPRDFCILSERLQLISRELEISKPKSMADLIRDNRDTVQYWTFWLVAIIGGIGILLSLTQIVLAAVQLAQTG